ncbi:cellulose synthase/poly-beta-1,6-N-acetylglucosamine synthase-like glycosyltransferase [Ulvibacter sp. MAR_2010_11]|uniref:glycosyltransferase n=1 Tax=Ulvibacter sp. MAR_2010_11 TaxID=1250229 RepID=UPI000C2C8F89|nr:glycosyltransferase [Ulvibacter sp. MAR_2010_11]PKA82260.1 cellulose synthase/poly-beta-1,6-N-acetylglucosamine synthase-like glycosyltransferase [Ulvibacter sp. MAR_2010_11]
MVLLYVFAAVVVINCLYYFLFSKFSFFNAFEKNTSTAFPVSLLVCAKNEAENLRKHIPLWLKQNYPYFEIILINDASYDDTLEVMEQFAETDARIKIVNVENNEAFWANKKYALTLGIKKAKHMRMVFTDADCRPASDVWLQEMATHFTEDKQLILGYGAYEKGTSFLNRLIRFETLMTAVQYFSYAQCGIPYMGVGRNLAYTGDLYHSTNGFMSHIKVASGDDDLFVNEVATKNNTAICVAENAFTYSLPKKTWKTWMLQKKRHITTAKLYKTQHRLLLALYYLTNFLFWPLAILCLVFLDWRLPLLLIVIRFAAQWIIVGKSAKKLKENDIIAWIPFLELFLVFAQLSIFISGSTSKSTRWK